MNKKTIGLLVGIILVGGVIVWLFFAGYLDFSGRTYYTPKDTSVTYTRQMNAKMVLEASNQRTFRLTADTGISLPFELSEDVIDKTAVVLRKVRAMEKEWHYGYTSLEEYILAARLGLFTYTGATQKFDANKICTLPVKDPETLMAIVDQFFAGLIHQDKNIEAMKVAVNKQLSYECGFLNLNPHENSLEAYLLEAHKFKKELDPQSLATFPIKNKITHYLIERGFALKGSPEDVLKIAQSYKKRKEPSILSYTTLLESQDKQWEDREYRAKVTLATISSVWKMEEHADEDLKKNTDPAWNKIAKSAKAVFAGLKNFSDAKYDTLLASSQAIDSQCSALPPNSIRSCVENKIALSYLYLYKRQYNKALEALDSAVTYPLALYGMADTYKTSDQAPWDVFKATRLARAQLRLHLEMKNYDKAMEVYHTEMSYRPYSKDVLELRLTLDALAKKAAFVNLNISR